MSGFESRLGSSLVATAASALRTYVRLQPMLNADFQSLWNSVTKRSVPLSAIEGGDAADILRQIAAMDTKERTKVLWSITDGFRPFGIPAHSDEFLAQIGDAASTTDPDEALTAARQFLPKDGICFILQGNVICKDVSVRQHIWHARDEFKADRKHLVLHGKDFREMPDMLDGQVIIHGMELPTDEMLAAILDKLTANVKNTKGEILECSLTDVQRQQIIACVRGQELFGAEQLISLSLIVKDKKVIINMERLRKLTGRMIAQTSGLSLMPEAGDFSCIGGLTELKEYLRLMVGSGTFDHICHFDELEKSGLAHQGDTSGVNADALGVVLQEMQDNKVFGVVLVGHPGTGKSHICKMLPGEFGLRGLRVDMGAMQDKYVGGSQSLIRSAMRTIRATGHRGFWVATCNGIGNIDSALLSRFSDVFFVDLPDRAEKDMIWDVKCAEYTVTRDSIKDEGWVGRNIDKICEKANISGQPLSQLAKFVVPESVVNARDITQRQRFAHNRLLSASHAGVYRIPGKETEAAPVWGREFTIDEDE